MLKLSSRVKIREGCWVSALYKCHDLKKEECIGCFNEYLEKNKYIKDRMVIGDFNIDLMCNDNCMEMQHFCCFQDITRPADDKDGVGCCTDNIFIKTKRLNTNAYKVTNVFADYYPLFLSIDKTKNKINNKETESIIDYNKTRKNANKILWTNCLDPELAADWLIQNIQELI